MIDKIFRSPRPHLIRWVGYYSRASHASLRITLSCAVLVGALLMQSCATQEMNTTEKAVVPSSNAAEGKLPEQDSAADVADSAPKIMSFENMYRDRYEKTPNEQE